MDEITIKRIQLMHPKLREELLKDYEFVNNQLPKNVRLRFTHTYRSPQEQDALFLKRPKVTNAKGWQSIHNYGLAFDIVLLIDTNNDRTFETASFKIDDSWKLVAKYFKSKGWEYGGDWKKFPDAPHFQKTFGLKWQDLKSRIDKGMTVKNNNIIYPLI